MSSPVPPFLKGESPTKKLVAVFLQSPLALIQGQERNSKLIAPYCSLGLVLSLIRDEMTLIYGKEIDFRPLHVDLSQTGDQKNKNDGETSVQRVQRRSVELNGMVQTLDLTTCWKFMGKEQRAFVLELNPLKDGYKGHITIGFFKTKDMIGEDERNAWIQKATLQFTSAKTIEWIQKVVAGTRVTRESIESLKSTVYNPPTVVKLGVMEEEPYEPILNGTIACPVLDTNMKWIGMHVVSKKDAPQ
jgi:hypothetical protein